MQRSGCILCTLNTAEKVKERTGPLRGGSAPSPTQQRGREAGGGAEKMKAAALSVESWRCSPNVQMTEGDGGGGTGEVGGGH